MHTEQVLIFRANIGDVSERKLETFKNTFMEEVKQDSDLTELSERASIDISVNDDAVLFAIKSKDNIDIAEYYPQLANALLKAFSVIFIERIEGVEINHIETFKVEKQLIDEESYKENQLGLENIIAVGHKYAFTKNGLKGDLIVEPDYSSYRNANTNQVFFSIRTGEMLQTNDPNQINSVIRQAQENYIFYINSIKDSMK